MTNEEIEAGLRTLDLAHPFYRAVLACLDQLEDSESDAVCAPNLTDAARHYNAGRLAAIKETRNQIAGAINIARNKHTDTKDDEAEA